MAKVKLPVSRPVRSSNIVLHKNCIDFENSPLARDWQLVLYRVPIEFQQLRRKIGFGPNRREQEAVLFQNMHWEIQEKLELPYYFHSFTLSLYVLQPKGEPIRTIRFDFLNADATPEIASYTDLSNTNAHILIKLLVSNFFYKKNKTHRICQPNFLVCSMVDERNPDFATAVEIEVREDDRGKTSDRTEFFIISAAVNLHRGSKGSFNQFKRACYEQVTMSKNDREQTTYLRQLKRHEVENASRSLWLSFHTNAKKATVPWYTDRPDKLENTQSFIVHDFQENFVAELNSLLGELAAEPKIIEMVRHNPKSRSNAVGIKEIGLPVTTLRSIYVFDNRLTERGRLINNLPFSLFLQELQSTYGAKLGIDFQEIVSEKDFSPEKPVLVIQDVTGVEFAKIEKEGQAPTFEFLAAIGLDDPKTELYEKWAHRVPLHSLTVNTNQPIYKKKSRYTSENYLDYLNYPVFTLRDEGKNPFETGTEEYKAFNKRQKPVKAMRIKMDVCVKELFLKDLLINARPSFIHNEPWRSLPSVGENPELLSWGFRHGNQFLFTDKNYISQIISLENSEGKAKFEDWLKVNGIIWEDVLTTFRKDYYAKDEKDVETKLKDRHFVFGPGFVVEILEPIERVLPQYNISRLRRKESVAGMAGIWYNPDSLHYTVGKYDSVGMKEEKSNLIRQLKPYPPYNQNFEFQTFIESLAVTYVRNKQWTVYPLFFDLLRLWRDDIQKYAV